MVSGAEPFEAAIRGTRMPIVITDAAQEDDPIVFANSAFLELTGYEPEEVLGRNCRFLQGPDTRAEDIEKVRRALAAREEASVELLNYRKDGSAFWNRLYVSPVRDDAGRTIYFFGAPADVTRRHDEQRSLIADRDELQHDVEARTRELEAALAEKTALLHEVDHRVKNNLQLISSLMLLQSRQLTDEAARAPLRSMLERVSAVATVHRRLFQGEDPQSFDVAAFVRDLAGDLALGARRGDVAVALELEEVEIPAASAAPLALVMNELVGNALKHAFPERPGAVTISAVRDGDACRLAVADDGVGLGEAADGFGLTIARLLCRQLHAEIELADAQPGLRAVVRVPVKKAA